MSTPPKSTFTISANFLGPVMSMQGELTKSDQNLIFARNGTGKSFVSRAFRYLDLFGQNKDIADAALNLISDEALDGKSQFVFSRGEEVLGQIKLERSGSKVQAHSPGTIFHVFSEDFVHSELREHQFSINGEIENQISVDSDTIAIDEKKRLLEVKSEKLELELLELRRLFDRVKNERLVVKSGVSKSLRDFRSLEINSWLDESSKKPVSESLTLIEIDIDLKTLKEIPDQPIYPATIEGCSPDHISLLDVGLDLKKITSPSSVAEDLKKKIERDQDFIKEGARIIKRDCATVCPFCSQDITKQRPKETIEAYLEYFADEEQKHKEDLRGHFRRIAAFETWLKEFSAAQMRQKLTYDDLKRHVPSKKDSALRTFDEHLEKLRLGLKLIKEVIVSKAESLSKVMTLPDIDLLLDISELNDAIDESNSLALDLKKAVERSDEERKGLQRQACSTFMTEFLLENWGAVDSIKARRLGLKSIVEEIAALEKVSPSKSARDRVADTFELLLKDFFGNKYSFNRETFSLQREEREMARGAHRTLSDGEKTAIAFCYFIACIHLKVESNVDYKRLFLVFDDPVTSMSYDYIFSIAQSLKNLGISNLGEISISPSRLDKKECERPSLLLLTHSTYFFNICRTNRVVQDGATFCLERSGAKHNLTKQKVYVAPFEQQLAHIFSVANGSEPDHGTGNSIRSVLEAVGRFCRPDKSQDLGQFIIFLSGELNITIRSALINSMSHGTYYDEAPTPEDIKLACREAIVVVEHFASGQVELLKGLAVNAQAIRAH